MNIAETPELFKHPLYQKIREIIGELTAQNLLHYGAGYCLSMADLVQNMLNSRGIKSSLLEVQLTLLGTNPPAFHVVGLQTGELINGQIATHVVVVVEHEQPLLIDCSISHQLPKPFDWVCGFINENVEVVGKYKKDTWELVYREKPGAQFPVLHQKNIRDRILLDQDFQKSLNQNKKLTKYAIGLFVAIILILSYDIASTLHLYSIANRNYDRIQKIEATQDNIMDRQNNLSERITGLSNRLTVIDEHDNIFDQRIADIEKLFHVKKK